jgi:hypothetical protein
MNRRNFILGLGTAATLSGAASVTGASISGTADAGANFQVIAENNLTIQRNSGFSEAANGEILNSTSENYVNSTVSYVDSEGTLNETIGSGIENVGGPRLTVNDQENGGLSLALATQNDATIEDNLNSTTGSNASPYSDANGTAPLEIVNNGGQDKTISASYTYGDDVGTGSLTESDVAQLFTFSINDNADINNAGQISPGTDAPNSSGDASSSTYQAEITSGGTATVDLTLNYSSDIEDAIQSAASGGSDYDFATDGFASVDLLQTVTFGEVDGT